MSVVGGPRLYDSDALTFFNVAGITDRVQRRATSQLTTDIKNIGIWPKMKAIYPLVGGVDTSHVFNLKDTRNQNEAYRLAFNGGWIHSTNGILPNGINGYANTFLAMNDLSSEDYSFGFYLNSTASNGYIMGAAQNNYTDYLSIVHINTTKVGYVGRSTFSVTKTGLNNTTHQGFWALSGTSGTKKMICSDGTFETISLSNNTWFSNSTLTIGAINSEALYSGYYNGRFAFVYISTGLTDTELTNLRTAVINFETALGRNV
jgi:hypothetical protein